MFSPANTRVSCNLRTFSRASDHNDLLVRSKKTHPQIENVRRLHRTEDQSKSMQDLMGSSAHLVHAQSVSVADRTDRLDLKEGDDMEFAFMIETIPGGSVPKCLSQDIWACEVSHAHALLAFLYAPTDTG